jgi:8-oxo-dGTP pyrophosphatase MutT (NUDIX family)
MPISDYLKAVRTKFGSELLLMPAVGAVIHNEEGEILLVYTTDDMWGTPGGGVDPGEQPADAVVREVFEEVGLRVVPERVLSIHLHHVVYPNGDSIDYTVTVFRCTAHAGELTTHDGEVVRWEWVDPAEATRRGLVIDPGVLSADYDGPTTFKTPSTS